MRKIVEKLKKALTSIKTYSETYKPKTIEEAMAAHTLVGMMAEEALEEVKEIEAASSAAAASL